MLPTFILQNTILYCADGVFRIAREESTQQRPRPCDDQLFVFPALAGATGTKSPRVKCGTVAPSDSFALPAHLEPLRSFLAQLLRGVDNANLIPPQVPFIQLKSMSSSQSYTSTKAMNEVRGSNPTFRENAACPGMLLHPHSVQRSVHP